MVLSLAMYMLARLPLSLESTSSRQCVLSDELTSGRCCNAHPAAPNSQHYRHPRSQRGLRGQSRKPQRERSALWVGDALQCLAMGAVMPPSIPWERLMEMCNVREWLPRHVCSAQQWGWSGADSAGGVAVRLLGLCRMSSVKDANWPKELAAAVAQFCLQRDEFGGPGQKEGARQLGSSCRPRELPLALLADVCQIQEIQAC